MFEKNTRKTKSRKTFYHKVNAGKWVSTRLAEGYIKVRFKVLRQCLMIPQIVTAIATW